MPSPVSFSPSWLSVVGSWTGLWGPESPPRFQVNGSLLSDASLPSIGSRRARFPDFIGTMKALRLPARAPAPLWFRLQAPSAPPVFVVAVALLMGSEEAHQAWDT